MRKALAAITLLVLACCSPSGVVEKGLTLQERSAIRGAIQNISDGDLPALTRKMPSELAVKIPAALPAMERAMPAPPLEISLTNADWNTGGDIRKLRAVYAVHGRSGWAIVRAATQTQNGRTLLTAMYVQQIAGNPRNLNGFSLAAAGASQWAVLIAAVAAFTITVAALIRIWRSSLFGKRWLWTIGALFGLMLVRVNWTTGQLFFQPLSVQLFSAAAVKSPIFAPWIVSASVPLVALIALFRKRGPGEEPRPEEAAESD